MLLTIVEDTCVLVAGSYLLTRGRTLDILLDTRRRPMQTLLLGAYFAGLAAVQDLLPESQHPYAPSTLVVTFAASVGGAWVGVLASIGAIGTALVLRELPVALATPPALVVSILSGTLLGRRLGMRGGFQTGVVAQAMALVANALAYRTLGRSFDIAPAVATVVANGFGVMLMTQIVRDAAVRREANQLALENEAARARMVQFELQALRSRLNPHFLYNTLSTIAALCTVAPAGARTASVRLGELMRRALEIDVHQPVTLGEEIDNCKAYLEIECLRLGDRLNIDWCVDASLASTRVPVLALATMVENAVLHGVGGRLGAGSVRIDARRSGNLALVSVRDDGPGIPGRVRRQLDPEQGDRPHGLALVNRELVLRYGEAARLRIHGWPGQGSLVAFAVPIVDGEGART